MRVLAIVACCFVASVAAFAQGDRGAINGTVSDPVRAVVPNAPVVARNADTGSQFQTVTTETGNYTLAQLPSGVYTVTVEAAGFSKYVQQGVRVLVAQTARIDVVLALGEASDSVTVTADATLLKTESAEQSYNIGTERVNNLPINFAERLRSSIGFVTLTPGASLNLTAGEVRTSVHINGSNSYGLRIEGQEAGSQMYPAGADGFLPSVEALQEVALQTSNFAAEYGEAAGGLFNFTTRSGTNEFHGSGYEYFGNEFLNAGIPFTNAGNGQLVRPRSRRHDFGFSGGGPVVIPKLYNGRNRTFFFANYEHFYERGTTTGGTGTVPTLKMRNGDFSEILTGRTLNTDPLGRRILENTVYDPATSRVVNGQIVRDPYPGNIIPASLIDPVARNVQAMLPPPTYSGIVNNFAETWFDRRDFSNKSVKIDHNVSAKLKLAFFYAKYHYDNNVHTAGDGLPISLSAGRPKHAYTHTARLNADYSIAPTAILHLGLGFIRDFQPDSAPPEQLQFDAVKNLGLVGSATNPSGMARFAGLSNAFGGSLNLGPTNGNQRMNDKPTSVVSVTWVRNNHTIKAGGEFRIDVFEDRLVNGSQGIYNFTAAETGLPSTNGQSLSGGTVGFPYASFLLGLVDNASVRPPEQVQYRKNQTTFFLQDTWKIRRNLSLDYGLRYDRFPPGHELYNRVSSFSPTTPNPSAGGLPGGLVYPGSGPGRCDCALEKTYPFAFGPRLGVAYQITPKLVFRGGWGIVYGGNAIIGFAGDPALFGVGWEQILYSNPSFGDPALVLRNGLQWSPAKMYTATFNPGDLPYPGQINSPPSFLDPNGGRPSRINQWSLGLQRQVTANLIVEAAYVGNRGIWETATNLINLNAITPQRLASFGLDINNASDRTLLTSRLDSPAALARGFKAPYAGFPLSSTVAQSLRPFPQFGIISAAHSPLGDNWYDALQAKATKRVSHGLDFTVSFTFSKELTTGGVVNDVFNRATLKYIDSNSQPFMLAAAIHYELPGFRKNRLAKAITMGWTIGAITRDASGLPILVPASTGNLNSLLFRGTYDNRVAGQPLFLKGLNCRCIDPSKDFVLNPKAWAEPAAGQFGDSALYYNDYRQQRQPDEQLSLGRTFHIRERMNLQVRAEFFNAFNRTRLVTSTSTNALQTQTVNAQGVTVSGFGRVDMGTRNLQQAPRTGQLIARFEW